MSAYPARKFRHILVSFLEQTRLHVTTKEMLAELEVQYKHKKHHEIISYRHQTYYLLFSSLQARPDLHLLNLNLLIMLVLAVWYL